MICKKDVIIWFKELESYKRIDTMCTLLSMCLPFELRFLGTCLEELGRRDSQELRGIELRVNNPQDLAIDMITCQKGEPTDMKIRRKMALYLALIRACNRNCNTSTEIFRTLDVWGDRDFESMNDMDTLQELLLVYTMAANHPVFTFEQHRRCIEVFERIKSNKLMDSTGTSSGQLQQHGMPPQPPPPPSHQEMHTLHTMHMQHPQLISCPTPIQVISQGSLPMNFPQHQIPVDAIQHMNLSNIIPVDSNTILAHPNPPWQPRPYPPHPLQVQTQMEHPPQSSSPMLSQQSSPSSSRATSPSRASSSNIIMQQGMQQQIRNIPQRLGGSTLKNVRRPSAETTPPPLAQIMNEINLVPPQNIKSMDDVVISNDGTGVQLQSLIRNGYTRGAHHRLKAGNFIPSQQQLQQQQQQQQSPVPQHYQPMSNPTSNFTTGLTYTMQNMVLSDGSSGSMHILDNGMVGMNSNKSTGSDSGSSIGSSGEISPPETPTILLNTTSTGGGGHRINTIIYKQANIGRLNGGRGEKIGVSTAGTTINYTPASTLVNTNHQHHNHLHHQQQQQHHHHHQGQSQFGDIILAPGGNAGAGSAANILQQQGTSLGSSNNNNNTLIVDINSSSANSNSTVSSSSSSTISSSTNVVGGHIGNVISTSNPMQQPQYNATYPFHTTQQHLTTSTRPPPPTLLAHNPAGMAQPPPPQPPQQQQAIASSFRFPMPPNGELIYPQAYHPASIAFLAATGATSTVGPPPAVTLRSASTVSPSAIAATATIPQQITFNPLSSGSGTIIAPKPISCYNCGSQTHTGRECQESSMDDVTRSAVYKLDYSVSAAGTTPSTTTSSTSTSSSSVIITADNTTTTENIHPSVATLASATSGLASTTAAATISNVK